MAQPYERGDIVRKQTTPGLYEYGHVEKAYKNGKLDVILDRRGLPVGWLADDPSVEPGTMDDLLEARKVVRGEAT